MSVLSSTIIPILVVLLSSFHNSSSIDEDIADNKSFAEVGFSYVIGFELEIKLGLSSAHPSCTNWENWAEDYFVP